MHRCHVFRRLSQALLTLTDLRRLVFNGLVLGILLSTCACFSTYGIYHRVAEGETWDDLVRLYQVQKAALLEANRLKPDADLRPGQKIFIPGAKNEKHQAAVGKTPNRSKPPLFAWPVDKKVLRDQKKEKQELLLLVPPGTPLKAMADGVVVFREQNLPGYGRMLILEHAGDWQTAYGRLGEFKVQENEHVTAGQTIAFSPPDREETVIIEVLHQGKMTDPFFCLPK